MLFPPLGAMATRDDPYIRIGRYFLPSTRWRGSGLSGWDAEQLLDVTEGNIIDYEEIEAAIIEASSLFQVEHLAYDPFQATMLVTRLQEGRAGPRISADRAQLQRADEAARRADPQPLIAPRRRPVMEWQISNVVARADAKDNVYPRKPDGQDHLKIDNPVALISALGVSMNETERDIGLRDARRAGALREKRMGLPILPRPRPNGAPGLVPVGRARDA
jgi:phage terminase large subunit-like protein